MNAPSGWLTVFLQVRGPRGVAWIAPRRSRMSLLMVALSCSSSSPRSVFKLLAPHDVDVHTFEVTGRGLRTLRDRELGEALLEVPDSGVVLAERVLEADSRLAAAAEHAAELGTPLSDEGVLACFVAQAMSGDAPGRQYDVRHADVRSMLRLMHEARPAVCHAPCAVCYTGDGWRLRLHAARGARLGAYHGRAGARTAAALLRARHRDAARSRRQGARELCRGARGNRPASASAKTSRPAPGRPPSGVGSRGGGEVRV